MQSQGLNCLPEEVNNLKGDGARAAFINHFKDVQKYRTQLDQYTDLTDEHNAKIKELIPQDHLRSFRGMYLETAKRLKALRDKGNTMENSVVEDLDFEFVLFASAIIDYDYIMALISKFTQQGTSTKERMTREQLIAVLSSSANLMDERDDIIAYINTLPINKPLTEDEIKEGFKLFMQQRETARINEIAQRHGIQPEELQAFIKRIIDRMIFDPDKLSDLFEPLELGWKARIKKELALMEDLIPVLKKMGKGHEISGLSAYEE